MKKNIAPPKANKIKVLEAKILENIASIKVILRFKKNAINSHIWKFFVYRHAQFFE